jgi:hypothetical protein
MNTAVKWRGKERGEGENHRAWSTQTPSGMAGYPPPCAASSASMTLSMSMRPSINVIATWGPCSGIFAAFLVQALVRGKNI